MSKRDYAVGVAPFLEYYQFEESTGFAHSKFWS